MNMDFHYYGGDKSDWTDTDFAKLQTPNEHFLLPAKKITAEVDEWLDKKHMVKTTDAKTSIFRILATIYFHYFKAPKFDEVRFFPEIHTPMQHPARQRS